MLARSGDQPLKDAWQAVPRNDPAYVSGTVALAVAIEIFAGVNIQ
jgi:hypothetical protein